MRGESIRFEVSDAVLALGVKCTAFALEGFQNRETDPAFDELRAQIVANTLADLTQESIAANSLLRGFRRLHDAVGRSSKKYVASPERLLRLLLQTGKFPHVNLLVDVYNLVSLKTHLSLGAHDTAAIRGNIHLRLTTGEEAFRPLSTQSSQRVGANEYAYVDEQNHILCRLEVRQSEATKITLATTHCVCFVQGNAATDAAYLQSTAEEFISLVKRFCGGNVRVLYPL